MTPEQVDRVFGHGRLKMVTGEHVEVFREAVVPGERRRYTKRFLNSTDGDFAHWTEREWRILARLIGHGIGCVPDVVQFDRGSVRGAQLVQTYDAGVTVDQWATLLPLYRDGHVYRHAFEDCAHWWALAHYCLKALKEIHQLQLVHLDIKGDNVCIPFGPASFDPEADEAPLYPLFGQLALIDFAFSLVSGESLTVALPIGWQREYDYQSPRLLEALVEGHDGDLRKTRELDWRCDIYSLAAMLKRYLPDDLAARPPERVTGWTSERYDTAKSLILTLRRHHDADAPQQLPHQSMIDATGGMLRESDLEQSLAAGWMLARDVTLTSGVASPLTPMTRIAPPIRVFRKRRERAASALAGERAAPDLPPERLSPDPERLSPHPWKASDTPIDTAVPFLITRRNDVPPPPPSRRNVAAYGGIAAVLALALGAAVAHQAYPDATRTLVDGARAWLDKGQPRDTTAPSAVASGAAQDPSAGAQTAPQKASDPDPATNVAAAEGPQLASSTDAPVAPDVPPTAPDERVPDTTETANGASGDSLAARSKPKADAAPPLSRMNPRASPPPNDSARTAGKRAPTKSAPLPSTRSSPPVASAKTPAGRYAAPASRAPIAGSNPSARSASTSSDARVVTAPAPMQLVPLTSHPAATETPSTAAPQPTEPVPPASPAGSQATQPASTPEPAAAAPKSSTATRRARASVSDDWRAGITVLSQLFGLTKQKAAPIEERSFQEIKPQPKTSRAPQGASPVPDRPAPSIPKVDVPPPVGLAPPVTALIPRIDAPPPIAPAPPPTRASTPAPWVPEDLRSPERVRESDYALQARRTLAQGVPRIAVQTQAEVAQVLWVAAKAQDPRAEREVVDSAQAIWVRDGATASAQAIEPAAARRLNEEAMQAYWVRRNIPEAFDLSLKAFGANPGDPEVAGNLAFLHLRVNPVQPETARQLALHAIAVRGSRFRTGRLEDWNTYALASALTGRDVDARNAMYVTLALAGSVERNCKAGLSAIANYGERVREPVEAMLYRIHMQGRAYESPYCAWPPNWAVGMRRQ